MEKKTKKYAKASVWNVIICDKWKGNGSEWGWWENQMFALAASGMAVLNKFIGGLAHI